MLRYYYKKLPKSVISQIQSELPRSDDLIFDYIKKKLCVHYAVAYESGEVIGWCSLAYDDFNYSEFRAYIIGVYVKKKYRGNGLAVKLTRFLLTKAKVKCKKIIYARGVEEVIGKVLDEFGFRHCASRLLVAQDLKKVWKKKIKKN